ncbi:MAG TPA: hypothetical protein VGR21_12715 [Cryptosporangiaceae bacterium]|nr:hypothetical protein [Cryptosporangiaceae bacterium]
MLNHLEPYLLAPSSLTPTALLQRAASLLDDPALAAALSRGDRLTRLRVNPLYDAWLVRWTPGEATDLHAHEGGYGAFAVVAGLVRETAAATDGLLERLVPAGERVAYRPGHVHRLAAVGETATLHLSSPPRAAAPCLLHGAMLDATA